MGLKNIRTISRDGIRHVLVIPDPEEFISGFVHWRDSVQCEKTRGLLQQMAERIGLAEVKSIGDGVIILAANTTADH